MGKAVWVYLLLINLQTDENGWILHGECLSTDIVTARLGCNEWTARKGLERLESEGYIERNRGANGWTIRITKPKKRFRRIENSRERKPPIRASENPRSGENARAKTPDPASENPRSPEHSLLSFRGSKYSEGIDREEVKCLSTPKTRAREDRLHQIFASLCDEHPAGCNPTPQLACQTLISRFADNLPGAEECLHQHRTKWQPAWKSGRIPRDLTGWIRDYDPQADVAPRANGRSDQTTEDAWSGL